jgi:CRISPR-associated protein Csh2
MNEENKVIENRSEIVFLYDITNANPNGDPDENKPRMDTATDVNLVSDVRLKRTVRDYLHERGLRIFVREEYNEDGKRKTKDEKSKDVWGKNGKIDEAKKKFKDDFIDLRLFGATIAVGGKDKESDIKAVKWTGPVQFKFGHSLHRVDPALLKGTTVEPSGKEKSAGTFTEFWYVPYSLISFYGVVNEIAAEDTSLRENDVDKLLDAIWNGTKGLITRSKFGQMPRFLMQVIYDKYFYIGELDLKVKLKWRPNGDPLNLEDIKGKDLRSINQVYINLDEVISALRENKTKIRGVRVRSDKDAHYFIDGMEVLGDELLEKLNSLPGMEGLFSQLMDVPYQ